MDLIEKLQPYVDYVECEIFTERQNMLKNAKTCATIIVDEIKKIIMKILTDLKCKFPSVSFCYNNKCVMIRYWGGLKFDKVVMYGGN